jgi:hypothetical protein
MIEFQLSVDALGKTRFAYSPLAEVASSLRLLGEGRHAYVMMPWLRDVRGPLQNLDFDLLQALAPPGRWAPEFLFAWSYNPATKSHRHSSDVDVGARGEMLPSLDWRVWLRRASGTCGARRCRAVETRAARRTRQR